jgi:hypothetical protein
VNGVNILDTPLGSGSFVSDYLRGKGLKHLLLLRFIKEVANAGFPREAEQMLKGAAVPRLSHILKSVQKNTNSAGWMAEMANAHLSVWLHCLTASGELETDTDKERKDGLSELLDMPASYGRTGLQSLALAVDEEFVGSFAGIASALISFNRNTELPAYIIKIVEALEGTESEEAEVGDCAIAREVKEAYARMDGRRNPLSEEESKTATALMKG